jgi:Transcription factor TFIID complex subunit 8 C-term.
MGWGVGWYAPLDDYDSIPFFPVELRNKDPRHTSDSRDSFKRKRGDDDDENVSFEENMFVSRKRMKNDISQQQQHQQQPGTNAPKGQGSKERKQGSSNFMSQQQDISKNTHQPSLPSYVPNFLPPFPPKHTYTKSITLPKPLPMDEFRAQNVRSSLVQLGRSYWGALPVSKDTHVDRDASSSSSSSRGVFVKVKTEPLDVSALASESVDVSAGGVEMKGGGVKPIVRASATRFSKILEGSMDVH